MTKAPKPLGRIIARGEPGFEPAVLGTIFNAHDPGRRPLSVVQAPAALQMSYRP